MQIRQLTDDTEKQRVTRRILEALPDWFGIPEAREEYIAESAGKAFFCAYDGDSPAGFLYLKETGRDTVELYVMGVLPQLHRRGVGRELLNRALGFKEFEVFPMLWDPGNPCQIYVLYLQ